MEIYDTTKGHVRRISFRQPEGNLFQNIRLGPVRNVEAGGINEPDVEPCVGH